MSKCYLCELHKRALSEHKKRADDAEARLAILQAQHDELFERKRKRDEESLALLALVDKLQKENAELRRFDLGIVGEPRTK